MWYFQIIFTFYDLVISDIRSLHIISYLQCLDSLLIPFGINFLHVAKSLVVMAMKTCTIPDPGINKSG